MEIDTLDTVAANNNQPAPDGAPENTMLYSQVNDTMREMMASDARWYSDINHSLSATGAAEALAVTTNRTGLTLVDKLQVAFTVATSATANGNTTTLTVTVPGTGALTTKNLVDTFSRPVIRKQLPAGTKVMAVYSATYDAFVALGLLQLAQEDPVDNQVTVGSRAANAPRMQLAHTPAADIEPQTRFDINTGLAPATFGYVPNTIVAADANHNALQMNFTSSGTLITASDTGLTTNWNISAANSFTATEGNFVEVDNQSSFTVTVTPTEGGVAAFTVPANSYAKLVIWRSASRVASPTLVNISDVTTLQSQITTNANNITNLQAFDVSVDNRVVTLEGLITESGDVTIVGQQSSTDIRCVLDATPFGNGAEVYFSNDAETANVPVGRSSKFFQRSSSDPLLQLNHRSAGAAILAESSGDIDVELLASYTANDGNFLDIMLFTSGCSVTVDVDGGLTRRYTQGVHDETFRIYLYTLSGVSLQQLCVWGSASFFGTAV